LSLDYNHDEKLTWNVRRYTEICSAAFRQVREQRQERSMNTFMLLTFVLIFLLGIVTGAWLNAITARSR
jgi:predicted nucleic acid-binding Zn ribbon protein